MERTPQPVPKPCYALEFDLTTSVCQTCEFQKQCFEDMGARRNRRTLDKLRFKLVPPSYNLSDISVDEDPELPHIEQVYMRCHQTVFGAPPRDSIRRYRTEVIANFRKTRGASLRLFMLANMVAHQQWQITISQKIQVGAKNWFRADLLTQPNALKRLEDYRDMCRREFGTFDIGSLSLLMKEDYAGNDLEKRMLHSEITAGRKLIAYKLRHGGKPYEHVYRWEELTLDPFWLATETSYEETVLKPHRDGARGTKTVNNHRHSVIQVIGEMKKRRDWSIAIFQAREQIMHKAMETILYHWGFGPLDFEFDEEIITKPMEFWNFLGRAIQHVHCLRYLDGTDETLRI